jgi:nucleolar complex protein 2
MASSKKSKATKKFQKNHLAATLEKRRAVKKHKLLVDNKAKKKADRAKDAEFYGRKTSDSADLVKPEANVSKMSVDEFFQGGYEIIEKTPSGKQAKANLGKRKRNEAAAAAEGDSDSSSIVNGDVKKNVEDDANSRKGATGMSKEAMDALAQKDPEFYNFLKENDPEMLEFDLNDDLAEVDALSGSEEEEEEEQPKKKRKKVKTKENEAVTPDNELTQEMVAKWKKSLADTKSLRTARQVVLAFRCAARLNDDEEESALPFSINSPDVFHDILMLALKNIPEVLHHHVPYKESAAHRIYVSTETKKFKTLSTLVKSYTASILQLLTTLSDDATLKLTLSALNPVLPYLLSFRKLLKVLIKTVVNFWARHASSEATRITAFLVMRRLTVVGDKGIRETILKATYQGLIQSCRSTNANTIQGINLMKNSAAELWGVDQAVGYTTAFTLIRQLAIHLRNSIVDRKKDAHRAVYNWQYIHSLDFWSCVLSEHCSDIRQAEVGKESQLKLLIYPLCQVTLGAMRLIPTAAFFPLRFHLIRSLLRLSRATDTYIPLASALLEVLNSTEMKKPGKSSTLKQLDFQLVYRTPKPYLRTHVYQNGVGEQVVELFSEYFVLWSTNIAFPEFSLPVIIMLKRWMKDARKRSGNKNGKLVSNLVLVVQKLDANSAFIEEKRAKIDFAPRDRSQVEAFLKDFEWEKTPLGAYVAGQRKMRAERTKVEEKARKEEEKKRKEEEQEELEEQLQAENSVSDDDEEDAGEDGDVDMAEGFMDDQDDWDGDDWEEADAERSNSE